MAEICIACNDLFDQDIVKVTTNFCEVCGARLCILKWVTKPETVEMKPEDKDGQEMVPGPSFDSIDELNVGQLRPMARDLKIKGWHQMVKAELVKAIKKAIK